MAKLAALLQFVLALVGVDTGYTLVHRIDGDGGSGMYSRTHVEAGTARFECLRSASGKCFYVLYPRDCRADAVRDCGVPPLRRFAVDSGGSRQIVGLARFRLCVGPDRDGTGLDCGAR